MSYCVNCGVELAPSEEKCPLCSTPVINPGKPWKEPKSYPYPKMLERVEKNIDRRYSVLYASLMLLIPIAVSVITDICIAGKMSWSWFVLGAGLCIFCWFLLPLLYKKKRVYLSVLIDVAAALLYLSMISKATSLSWYFPLAFPITLSAGVFLFAIVYTARHRNLLQTVAAVFLSCGVLCVVIEICVDMFANGAVSLFWSLIVFVSAVFCALLMWFINKKQQLKEEIQKRLFM